MSILDSLWYEFYTHEVVFCKKCETKFKLDDVEDKCEVCAKDDE